jgi:hypothetical protein
MPVRMPLILPSEDHPRRNPPQGATRRCYIVDASRSSCQRRKSPAASAPQLVTKP